jgi:uncharacterized membrane protein
VLGLDVYVSTFVQLALAGVVLVAASLATGDVAQLGSGSAAGIAWFAGAGVVHFFGGWTFLSLSQSRIGAARTSPLISTAPVFGVFIAAATLHEWPTAGAVGGIAVVLLGVYLVALERLADSARPPVADAIFGICTALCWSASPVMIKHGLRGVPSPLLGVTIGMICALAVYGAQDAGLVVNPGTVETQIEGSMMQGASRALIEELKFSKSRVTSLDWGTYPVIRFKDAPKLTPIVVQRTDQKSTGSGEPPLAPVPAAIATAFFDATGVRLREYPMTPARVRAALAAAKA